MSSLLWRAVGALALAAFIFAAGWQVNGWRKDAEIAELTAARAQADLAAANQAMGDLRAAGATIREKADEFAGIQTALTATLDTAVKEFRNAKKPLPVDCRPDDFRLRKLSDAVSAAKQAATAR